MKYPFVLIASLAVLFLSYHFLVRSTFIGQTLNGRRYPRNKEAPAPPSPSLAPPSTAEIGGRLQLANGVSRGRQESVSSAAQTPRLAPVAQMRGIVKRFGATTALAGIDIEVRSGELLAVLGPNGFVVIAKGRVVASGTVYDVRALVARRQISCESSVSIDDVRDWPGVVEVARDDRRLRITATDAEGVVRRLLEGDGELNRLEVRQAGLNEALTELTREAA